MDRLTLGLAGGVLALVLTGVVVAASLRGQDAAPDLSTPGGVALGYALAEQRGDPGAAWELLASSAQAATTRDQFILRAGGPREERGFYSTEDERVTGDSATVVLVHTYPSSGGFLSGGRSYADRTTVLLVREAPGWRITVPPDRWVLIQK
jgi:hypothetical protein